MTLEQELRASFGSAVERDAPLAPLTTFKVGGPADWLVTVASVSALARAVEIARRHGVPVTVLGGGSNVLVADRGLPGVVVRVRGGEIRETPGGVRADAGVTINGLVRWMLNRGLAGLEAWAGTPGTVGGAVRGNAHFQGRLIGERIARVALLCADGRIAVVPQAEMEFGYDTSRPQRTGEVVLWAEFRAEPGDPAVLRHTARASLAYRKATQPLDSPSAGCIFRNPDPTRDRLPDGLPPSAGALIDRAGLKGARAGGAMISPTHANFIVNTGGATAADIRRLVERCKREVRERFGIELREEIVYLGAFA
ncbi:MAG TPA: UDP-N-acetylmuramate dehydrogenase [Vicinamibacterales bacterium]|nr:UDP-N-acetylmuramate dehydrogenase [Vicinamibacterales bacterium]